MKVYQVDTEGYSFDVEAQKVDINVPAKTLTLYNADGTLAGFFFDVLFVVCKDNIK